MNCCFCNLPLEEYSEFGRCSVHGWFSGDGFFLGPVLSDIVIGVSEVVSIIKSDLPNLSKGFLEGRFFFGKEGLFIIGISYSAFTIHFYTDSFVTIYVVPVDRDYMKILSMFDGMADVWDHREENEESELNRFFVRALEELRTVQYN